MKKIISKIFLSFLMCFFINICYAQNQAIVPDAKLRTGKLTNGLTYYIRHNDIPKNRADFYLVQRVGSILEKENQRGLAHFLEHMAFNGTKNFPGRMLIGELEKKGIKFGTNINASTGYDQTIYKLVDIPVTTNGIIDTALLILHDWSGFIINNDQDIEEERGVIREEWRTRSISTTRVLENGIFPVVFQGSAYANHIPIGSLQVINNFKPQELKDYYQKWYRPDLQAVIVVGNVDVDKIEAQLKNIFVDIPAPINAAKRMEFTIPDNKEPIIAIATDPELTDLKIEIHWKRDNFPKEKKSSLNYYKTAMLHQAIGTIITNRFSKMNEKNRQAYTSVSAIMDKFLVAESKSALTLNISPVNIDSAKAALRIILVEMERIKRFGFTAIDLENYKKNALHLLDREYSARSKRENFEYILKCIANFTENEPLADPEWDYQTRKQTISELLLDSINQVVQHSVGDANLVFVVTGPEKEKAKLPEKEEIIEIWRLGKKLKLSPYVSSYIEKKTIPEINPTAGKVIKTEQKPFGFIQWTLSNGAKVQFKQTDEKDSDLYIWGYSPGGISVLNDEDLPSALAMNKIINQKGIVDPERNAVLTFNVNNYDESFGGKTSNLKEIETLFRLLYLRMTNIEKQEGVFERYMQIKKREVSDLSLNPKDIFLDTLNSIMANHHPRSLVSLKEPKTLEKVDYDKIIQIYKKRFENAGDFIFFIAGNVKPDRIKTLVEKYLGGLPSSNTKEKIKDHGMYPPKGVLKNHFKIAMETPQSTVTIGYTGKISLNLENQILMECLTGVLKIVYIDEMREKEGGTYRVGVNGEINKFPVERFIFQLNFDTDPAKEKKLIEIAYKRINDIRKNGPESEKLEKVKQNLLKVFHEKVGDKNVYYWLEKAWMLQVYELDTRLNYENLVLAVTPKKIQDFAKMIFSQGNVIEVIMTKK